MAGNEAFIEGASAAIRIFGVRVTIPSSTSKSVTLRPHATPPAPSLSRSLARDPDLDAEAGVVVAESGEASW